MSKTIRESRTPRSLDTAAERLIEREMDDFFKKYKLGKKLGEGAFGEVYICEFIMGQNKVQNALKILNKAKLLGNRNTADLLENELSILMKANHPNIVRMFDIT